MLPIGLRLTSLRHCYVQLPDVFVSKETNIRPGSIISISSIQDDNLELFVIWNGRRTGGEFVELDLDFARANGFKDPLVVIRLAKEIEARECSLCRVELLNNSDYTIVSQHLDTNLLDTCKLVSKNMVVILRLSQHVPVQVKVVDIQPGDGNFGLLTQWTEMQFQHSANNNPENETEKPDETNQRPITNPIAIVSCALGVNYRPKFSFGSVLICGERGSGKTHMLKTILDKNYERFNTKYFNCKQVRGKRLEALKKLFNEMLTECLDQQPSILGFDDIDSFVASDSKQGAEEVGQDAVYKKRLIYLFCHLIKQLERSVHAKGKNVIIIATAKSLDTMCPKLSKPEGRKYFTKIIQINSPTLEERVKILKTILSEHKQICSNFDDGQLRNIAEKTNNFMPVDLRRLVERSIINACSRSFTTFSSEPLKFITEDLQRSLTDYIPSNLRGVTLNSKTERNFDSVGGMKEIKETLLKTVLMPIKYPKLFKRCPLKIQTSVLLYGPPGCGKTLVAEALTNQQSINSILVKGPELLSKYIGASEAAVRNLFKRAEQAKPCIIFFDEFESLVSKRGVDSTGVTDRVVNQFLTIMDGVEKLDSTVFVIAATSRPDMIDPAILRPGRMDKLIYCPLPSEVDRYDILKVLGRNLDFCDGVNSEESFISWAKRLEGFTGADIQSLLYSAQLKALHETIETRTPKLDDKKSKDIDLDIRIKLEHLMESYEEMKNEVSARHRNILIQYPKSILKNATQILATRTTLA